MNNLKKTTIAILLTSTMLLSACGNGGNTAPSTQPAATTTTTAATTVNDETPETTTTVETTQITAETTIEDTSTKLVEGEVYTSGDFEYMLDTANALDDYQPITIKRYTGSDKVITIPEEIDGYTVDNIGKNAIEGYEFTVELPDSLKDISAEPFKGSDNTMIYKGETYWDTGIILLKMMLNGTDFDVVEPPIKDFEYHYDSDLGGIAITEYKGKEEAIRFPAEIDGDPVITLLNYTCPDEIRYVEIPEGVKVIGDDAFSDSNLVKISLPESLERIGNYAFSTSKIRSITIPENVTEIGHGAFLQARGLNSIDMPEHMTRMGMLVFEGCSALKSIKLPTGIETLEEDILSGCTSLTELTIPEGVKEMKGNGIGFLENLKTINFPDSLESLAFSGSPLLENVVLPSNLKYLSGFYKCDSLTEIVLPDGLETIKSAFNSCKNLKMIEIPDSVKYIWNSFDSPSLTVKYKGQEYDASNVKDIYTY